MDLLVAATNLLLVDWGVLGSMGRFTDTFTDFTFLQRNVFLTNSAFLMILVASIFVDLMFALAVARRGKLTGRIGGT
jgi:hypothetical protein